MIRRLENIFLMRHGNSEANRDIKVYHAIPDHAIKLSPRGIDDAKNAGVAFKHLLSTGSIKIEAGDIRSWNSPYERTRETLGGFMDGLDMPGFFRDAREDILLTEQRFGLFDGLTDEECLEKYPEEARKFNLCKEHSGWFYAQPPNGESRFDVCVRVRQYFGTIIRDAEKSVNSMPNVFIVSHGTTIRAFMMMWLHLPVEWFEAEPNPKNGSIRHIGRGPDGRWKDFGYIHAGRRSR